MSDVPEFLNKSIDKNQFQKRRSQTLHLSKPHITESFGDVADSQKATSEMDDDMATLQQKLNEVINLDATSKPNKFKLDLSYLKEEDS